MEMETIHNTTALQASEKKPADETLIAIRLAWRVDKYVCASSYSQRWSGYISQAHQNK